jgi:hypothetical protein
LDAKGFVLTGGDCNETRNPLETSRRGIFAIGDPLGLNQARRRSRRRGRASCSNAACHFGLDGEQDTG